MSNDAFSSEHGIFRGTQTGVCAQGHREGLQREDQLKKLGSFTWMKKSSPEGISDCPVKPGLVVSNAYKALLLPESPYSRSLTSCGPSVL